MLIKISEERAGRRAKFRGRKPKRVKKERTVRALSNQSLDLLCSFRLFVEGRWLVLEQFRLSRRKKNSKSEFPALDTVCLLFRIIELFAQVTFVVPRVQNQRGPERTDTEYGPADSKQRYGIVKKRDTYTRNEPNNTKHCYTRCLYLFANSTANKT